VLLGNSLEVSAMVSSSKNITRKVVHKVGIYFTYCGVRTVFETGLADDELT